MKKVIILLMLVLLVGCSKEYIKEELEEIYQECDKEGNMAWRYWNHKEDMTSQEAVDLCMDYNLSKRIDDCESEGFDYDSCINKTVWEDLECVSEKNNYTFWLEAVRCVDFDKVHSKVYGNCDYVKESLIEEGYSILATLTKCK